ncbi:MAG TPA: hypothetical protein VIW68_12565 [Candidatus Sulfotelmatobacter sp.]
MTLNEREKLRARISGHIPVWKEHDGHDELVTAWMECSCGGAVAKGTVLYEKIWTDHILDALISSPSVPGEPSAAGGREEITENASDGYHTFKELYEHRHALFAAVVAAYGGWKSLLHHDGTMFDGWFIAGVRTPQGDATYHMPLSWYAAFPGEELKRAPEWDGHTPYDAAYRIARLAMAAQPPLRVSGPDLERKIDEMTCPLCLSGEPRDENGHYVILAGYRVDRGSCTGKGVAILSLLRVSGESPALDWGRSKSQDKRFRAQGKPEPAQQPAPASGFPKLRVDSANEFLIWDEHNVLFAETQYSGDSTLIVKAIDALIVKAIDALRAASHAPEGAKERLFHVSFDTDDPHVASMLIKTIQEAGFVIDRSADKSA